MSVPSSISQLSTTPGLNSPVGSEPIGNNASLYLQAHAAFIAQLANGSEFTPNAAISMNSFQINNLANGTANTDAVNYSQLKAVIPIKTVFMWSGAVADIASTWGANYALCNGQNGTPNLMDKFVVGAGNLYTPGATGGSTSYTLSVANLPAHSHAVTDFGHVHGIFDPGHVHGVNDAVHSHSVSITGRTATAGNAGQGYFGPSGGGSNGEQIWGTSGSSTGISIQGAASNISVNTAASNITIANTGSGTALSITPPYYALCYVMKVANN